MYLFSVPSYFRINSALLGQVVQLISSSQPAFTAHAHQELPALSWGPEDPEEWDSGAPLRRQVRPRLSNGTEGAGAPVGSDHLCLEEDSCENES